MARVTAAQFRIEYQGVEDDYHDLDAALLSQALMGLSEMGRVAYRITNPTETHTLNVKVQALEAGSFEIALEAVVPALEHLYGQVVGIFNRPDAQAVATAGGIGGVLAGAYDLIRWIRGRKYTTKRDEETTTITTEDGDSTTVPTNVYNIAGNATFIRAAGETLVPLEDPHYDRMSISDAKGKKLETVYEEDRGYFKIDPDTQESDETLTIEVGVATVQLLVDSSRLWGFTSGDQKFNARMSDEKFAEKVRKGEIILGDETRLLVDRRTVVKKRSDGSAQTHHAILQVRKIINPGENPQLF